MAIKKVRIRPEGENNYADIIHPETSADIVVDTPTKVVMTKEERDKLSGIQAGANKTTIDNTLTSTSTTQALSANQGKVLDNKINNLSINKADKAEIPNKTSQLTNDSGYLTSVPVTSINSKTGAVTLTKSDVGLSDVDNVKQMPIGGGVLENYREILATLSGTSPTINLNNGNNFKHTLSGNTAYNIENAVGGQTHSFTLIITQPSTAYTITFPANVKWQGGEIPDLSTANKTYILTFLTITGGGTFYGMFGGEF